MQENGLEQFGAESEKKTLRTEIVDLFLSFNKKNIKNSQGLNIPLKAEKKPKPQLNIELSDEKEDTEAWTVEFLGYPGEKPAEAMDESGNYVSFLVDYDNKIIDLQYARLEHEDLKGKNVYPQIIQSLGERFPQDFRLEATIRHEKTREKAINLLEQFRTKQITEDELSHACYRLGMLRLMLLAGFNEFTVRKDEYNEIIVTSKKIPKNGTIKITF
ncbi:MAG: hypothetical protein COT92_00335 [Candidatus Doudnabacteria bacterium CG10_big_fil_rev_8_21_14_0_10_42_18]|uniref:Uncharacterized protein n=1 Tax=Candidatus Doudnabacteria bacterium CG10_big_fil_rev_8_21_14_0_10_42_18 TaxID=1974552 RepID=A0A2H0VBT6_9BACT|nr:MAG: hypothetical protein COT92_00335 [Candidatus Doudnabacteria bacterium CG10_big_fil_rev_8_21_14_0_10_42_18]